MKPISIQPNLVNQVYSSIRDAICEGKLSPGQKLNQDELASQLQVSRQPIVQALQILKSHGFVQDSGRRGVEVTPLTSIHVTKLYQICAALDGLAAREAARNSQDKARAHGEALINAGRKSGQSGSIPEMIETEMKFHNFIYEISENPIIKEAISPYLHHIRRIAGIAFRDAKQESIWDEHQAILNAIVIGDDQQAEYLAKEHAEQAGLGLVDKLRPKDVDIPANAL